MENKEIEELAKRLQEFVIEKCDLVEHPTSRMKVLTNNRAKTIAEMLVNERKPEPQQEKLCPPFLQPVCTPEMAERSGANKIMKQEKELLPCPFCGGEARLDVGDYYNIGCANSNCLMFTVNKVRSCRDKDECIKAWNTRPSKCGLDNKEVLQLLNDDFGYVPELTRKLIRDKICSTFTPQVVLPTVIEILDAWNIIGSTKIPISLINNKIYHYMNKEELAKATLELLKSKNTVDYIKSIEGFPRTVK